MACVVLLIQLILAQHFTVHFQEEEYRTLLSHDTIAHAASDVQGQKKQEDDKQDPDKICQICVYSKYLSQAILAATFYTPDTLAETSYTARVFNTGLKQFEKTAYLSRGPPTSLS